MTNDDYLMIRIPGAIKHSLTTWLPKLQELWELIEWHGDAAVHLYWQNKSDLSRLAKIVSWNHFDIAHTLASAHVQLYCGFLVDALTVLRPAVEHMIDIQYFKRWPAELQQYQSKLDELMELLGQTQNRPIRRDPRQSGRFINAGKMCECIRNDEPTEHEERLIYQWSLLSNIAEHVSPERHLMNLKFPDVWINAIGQTDMTARIACHQLYYADAEINAMIEDHAPLVRRFKKLRREPIVFPITDLTPEPTQ